MMFICKLHEKVGYFLVAEFLLCWPAQCLQFLSQNREKNEQDWWLKYTTWFILFYFLESPQTSGWHKECVRNITKPTCYSSYCFFFFPPLVCIFVSYFPLKFPIIWFDQSYVNLWINCCFKEGFNWMLVADAVLMLFTVSAAVVFMLTG